MYRHQQTRIRTRSTIIVAKTTIKVVLSEEHSSLEVVHLFSLQQYLQLSKGLERGTYCSLQLLRGLLAYLIIIN
jgi:hypothetical protein